MKKINHNIDGSWMRVKGFDFRNGSFVLEIARKLRKTKKGETVFETYYFTFSMSHISQVSRIVKEFRHGLRDFSNTMLNVTKVDN